MLDAEIGTGMVDFEPIADGERFPLIAGPQGGHHFVLHSRMSGLAPGDVSNPGDPDNPSTFFMVINENGDRVEFLSEPYTFGYEEAEDGWLKIRSARIVVVVQSMIDTLIDRPVRLRLEIQDVDGRVAMDEVLVDVFEVPLPDAATGAPGPRAESSPRP